MIKENLKIYRGDTHIFEIVVTDEADNAIDLSNMVVTCDVKSTTTDEVINPLINVVGNVITLTFSHDLTKDITWFQGQYDVQIDDSGIVTTVIAGRVNITQDITL